MPSGRRERQREGVPFTVLTRSKQVKPSASQETQNLWQRLPGLAQLTVGLLVVNALFYVVVTVLNGGVIVPVVVLFAVDVVIAIAIVATRARWLLIVAAVYFALGVLSGGGQLINPSGQADDLVNASILVSLSVVGIASAIGAAIRGSRRDAQSAT
jgi:hypothetical protein